MMYTFIFILFHREGPFENDGECKKVTMGFIYIHACVQVYVYVQFSCWYHIPPLTSL